MDPELDPTFNVDPDPKEEKQNIASTIMSPCATLVQYDGIIYSCLAGAGVLLRCAAGHAGQQS